MRQLAALGQALLTSSKGEHALPDAPAVEAAPLVRGGKEVGHRDFPAAKRILPRVYAGMEVDFYCGCRYQGKAVDWASCGYQPRKSESRASRIEWEHVVPAWVLGHQRQCWQKGGRKACGDTDPLFQMAEGDLNNLVPAVGEVNGDRANFSYGAWEIHPRPIYGQCQSLVDFKQKRFQPREEVRGSAARITLYMHQRYGLRISQQDKQLMCAWARKYPVDEWERQRNRRIIQWQGEGNFLVSQPGELDRVCN
ncbi:endonuclease [Chromobacterium subtsugae]|uniref:endonuclease n=1 Tax=Chromobacterium subtsugae TaxID=251747 RepID=UPI00096FEC6A|nr:endonuclease [Chromobacterium subtsugae]